MEPPDDFKAKLAASRQKALEKKQQAEAGNSSSNVVPPPSVSWSGAKPPKLKKSPVAKVEDIHKTPPHSVEAEQGVLSSIMIDSQFGKSTAVIAEVASVIKPWHFYVPAHKTIFEMFIALWKDEKPIELIGFTQILRDKRLLDSIGGAAFVTSLVNFVPTASNVTYYMDIVLEQARRREMIALGTHMVRAAYGSFDEDSAELMKSFEGRMSRLREDRQDPSIVDVAQMLNGEKPPLPRLIVRRLLHQGSKMIIGGSSKARKTWGLMDLALSVSTGNDWWGFHTYKSRVCYINLELQDAFFAWRLDDLCKQKGVTPEVGWFDVLNLRGRVETVESLRLKYTPFLRAGHFSLLIIDPSYKLLGGRDENSAGEIATLLNEFEKIAVDIDAAIVFASHYSKGNQALKEFMDRIGGSGVFARDPDTVLTMTQHEENDCFTVESRCRNLASPPPFVVRWEYPLFHRDDDMNPDQLRGKGGAPSKWSEQDILDQMSIVNGMRITHLQEQCEERIGMSKASFYRYWNPMRKKGEKVRCDSDGLWYSKGSFKTSSETAPNSDTEAVSDPF